MRSLLAHPNAFPVVIMVLYAASAVRYAFARDLGRCCYWLSALCITVTVTFLMRAK